MVKKNDLKKTADELRSLAEQLTGIADALTVEPAPKTEEPEKELSYEKWVRDGFGTADALVVADGTLHVIDYKNGKGVLVECEDNSQMR